MAEGQSGAPSSEFLRLQAAVAGRYSLDRELGRGGMGIVFLARDVALDRLVALKLLPPALAARPALRERFLREARTAAKLSHPNIVPIFSVDEIGEFVFFVMAFIHGVTLGERVRTRGPLAPSEATRVLREVAWALAYAHAQGIVHRDVKPDNILLETETGRALVADFGIADLGQTSARSGPAEIVGTAEFISPEQASGAQVDGRSDIYSLGVVAFYVVSGRLPFEGDSIPAILAKHITEPPPPVAAVAPALPRRVAIAIDRCLAKNCRDRFQKGQELAAALGNALEARREIAIPIRAFHATTREYGQALLGLPFVWITFLPMGVVAALAGDWGLAISFLGVSAVITASPLVALIGPARRALESGYGPEAVAEGVRAETERESEERRFEWGLEPRLHERVLRWLSGAGVATAAGAAAVGMQGLSALLGVASETLTAALIVGGGAGFVAARHVVREEMRLSLRHPPKASAEEPEATALRSTWRGRFITWWSGVATACAGMAGLIVAQDPAGWVGAAAPVFVASLAVGAGAGLLALQRHDYRTGLLRRWFAKLWTGPAGHALFQVAGVGLKRSSRTLDATHRPTELAIGMAVDTLFDALPKATREQLSDLPATVRALEADAATMRQHVHALDETLGAMEQPAGERSRFDDLETRRAALEREVRGDRDVARHRLADAVAALEGIRLNLLRLTAGGGSVDSLTEDLAAARDVSEGIERLLESEDEVQRILHRGPMAITPS